MSNRLDICTPRAKKDGGTYWVKIGTAWQNEKGIQLVFDALPLPDSEGRVVANLFEPKPRDGAGGGQRADTRQPAPAYDDDPIV
jgi:hypothetical protein